jgi:hypothetical protein
VARAAQRVRRSASTRCAPRAKSARLAQLLQVAELRHEARNLLLGVHAQLRRLALPAGRHGASTAKAPVRAPRRSSHHAARKVTVVSTCACLRNSVQ